MARLVVTIEDDLMTALEKRSDAEDRELPRVVVRALRSYLSTSEGVVGTWPPVMQNKASE
jgi:metal-responsive CopG/Arc/MetJ family transcriptional regulator